MQHSIRKKHCVGSNKAARIGRSGGFAPQKVPRKPNPRADISDLEAAVDLMAKEANGLAWGLRLHMMVPHHPQRFGWGLVIWAERGVAHYLHFFRKVEIMGCSD
ncbi:MAG: hypothetical protein J0M04_17690 [Verrucomicrobia bacterium]|nr:hypothetical protein [Verrucomicrobiota bacterium]